jgi:hypothetical protein
MWVFHNSDLSMIELYCFWKYVDLLSNNFIWLTYWRFRFWSGLIFVYFFTVFCDLYALIWIIIFFFVIAFFTMKKLTTSSPLISIFRGGRSSQFNFIRRVLLHCDTAISYAWVYRRYLWWILWGFGR